MNPEVLKTEIPKINRSTKIWKKSRKRSTSSKSLWKYGFIPGGMKWVIVL